MSDKIFAKWIFFNQKHDKAPEFVLGSMSIDIGSFDLNSLKQYANGKYVRLQVLMGKDKPYVLVDTYKSENKMPVTDIDDESCPF